MKLFNTLFQQIDRTTSTREKVEALIAYFKQAKSADALWAIYLLIGKSTGRFIKTAWLRQAALNLAHLPHWLFEESYHTVGDLAETIALCLPAPTKHQTYSLSQTMAFLGSLPSLSEQEAQAAISKHWMELPIDERFIFNKLITGNFRMGVSKQLVIKALAETYHKSENEIAHRLMGHWHPMNTPIEQLLIDDLLHEKSFEPYPFFLAYPLDKEPATLGKVNEWFIERKLDGIRGQIIVRNQHIYIWSRGEELLTDRFPEFHALAKQLPNGTVIDGEILPYKDGNILPFSVMQTRISRKQLGKQTLAAAPLVMVCYDLLECDGADIRELSLMERRSLLEKVLALPPLEKTPLMISKILPCSSWEDVEQVREQARQYQAEGVMLKRKTSRYEAGRRRGNWWKWKINPYTIDGILIYAQPGHGRRANLFTDYTFAVWDADNLVPFAKAYSGLSDQEIITVDRWIKQHTIDKFGPVRSVTPELVFELAFEGISASNRHKSGIALRFPRIVRWRHDKVAKEANTKADLLDLLDHK